MKTINESTTQSIKLGDCAKVLKTIEDNSIDLVVTSPPYDNIEGCLLYTSDAADE